MILFLLLFACDDTTTEIGAPCVMEPPALSVESAVPGDAVVLTAGPLTEAWDTVVTVGSALATVTTVDRSEDCADCDECRFDEGCGACGECSSCASTCNTCEESLTFTVPEGVASGAQPVVLRNTYGSSRAATLTIAGADTGGGTDTGGDSSP